MADLDQLRAAHEALYRSLEDLVSDLDADDWDRPTGCPGWSVHDVVAHVIGVEAAHLGDPEPDHELPGDLPHVRDDFGRYTERHVDVRRPLPADALREELRDVLTRRRAALAAIADLGQEVPSVMGTTAPAARVLSIRVLDLWMHEQDLRRTLGRPGHLAGPAVEVSLRRIDQGVAHFLPQRLAGARGRVVLRIGDAPPHVLALELETGEQLGAAPPDPEVRIAMDLAGYAALAGGRSDAPGLDEVEVTGDRGLAERVLPALSITP